MDQLPEWLSKLSPQSIVAVIVLWILREFFGFVRMLIKDLKGTSQTASDTDVAMQVDMKLITKALDAVADHIQESTNLTRSFITQIESLNRDISELRREVREMRVSSPQAPH